MDPPVHAPPSLATRLSRRVLEVSKTVDGDARIASVARWDSSDATLVRVTSKALGNTGTSLVNALKAACPLASISLVENYVDGTTEAQLLLPSDEEQREVAMQLAMGTRGVRVLGRLLSVGVWVALLALAVSFITN